MKEIQKRNSQKNLRKESQKVVQDFRLCANLNSLPKYFDTYQYFDTSTLIHFPQEEKKQKKRSRRREAEEKKQKKRSRRREAEEMTSAVAGAEGVPGTPVPSQSSSAATRARRRTSNLLIRASDGMFAWIAKPSFREFLAELIGTFVLIVSDKIHFCLLVFLFFFASFLFLFISFFIFIC